LEEQRRIAGILGAIDDKIENNRRINTNLELQAQALFDNLMSNSNLEYKLIADINHIIETGRRPKGGVANITSGVSSIGAENIKGLGKYDYSKTKYITAEFAETLKKGIIKGYELLIYKDGGKPGYFIPNFSIFGEGFPYDNMTLNEHVFLLDFGNKGYNFFAYFYMQTEEVMKYLNAQGSKAAIPGINRNDVENISIPRIENEKVKKFCAMVEPILTSILINSKESSRLATLRDTLLPKLMNGEIKL
jgi:type I restriction enzyme S subunit